MNYIVAKERVPDGSRFFVRFFYIFIERLMLTSIVLGEIVLSKTRPGRNSIWMKSDHKAKEVYII